MTDDLSSQVPRRGEKRERIGRVWLEEYGVKNTGINLGTCTYAYACTSTQVYIFSCADGQTIWRFFEKQQKERNLVDLFSSERKVVNSLSEHFILVQGKC